MVEKIKAARDGATDGRPRGRFDEHSPDAPDVSTPPAKDDRTTFDFQLRGPVYHPYMWYWASDDGKLVYSSERDKLIRANDPAFIEWKGDHERAPTIWPRELDGSQTIEAMREVMKVYGKKVQE